MQKKQYSEPTLTVYGKVEELTLTTRNGGRSDVAFGAPIPPSGGTMS